MAFSGGAYTSFNGPKKEFKGRVLKLDKWKRVVERMCLNIT